MDRRGRQERTKVLEKASTKQEQEEFLGLELEPEPGKYQHRGRVARIFARKKGSDQEDNGTIVRQTGFRSPRHVRLVKRVYCPQSVNDGVGQKIRPALECRQSVLHFRGTLPSPLVRIRIAFFVIDPPHRNVIQQTDQKGTCHHKTHQKVQKGYHEKDSAVHALF